MMYEDENQDEQPSNNYAEIDMNDESTWPEDLDQLAALADGLPDKEDEAKDEHDSDDVQTEPEEEKDEADSEAVLNEDAPGDAADESEENGEATDSTLGESDAEDEVDDDPEGVATADGKNIIPFNVLKTVREQLAASQAKIAELEAANQQVPTTSAVQETPAAQEVYEVPADIQSKADSLKADLGDEVAETFLENHKLRWQQDQLSSKLDSVMQQVQTSQQAQAQSEEQQIQAAIDSSPNMLAWQSDADGTSYGQAVSLHQHLMATDPGYQQKSWSERFAELPNRVNALYGTELAVKAAEAPASNPAKKPTVAKKTTVEAAKEKAAPAKKAPTSMSEIGAGAVTESKTIVQKAEEMSTIELQSYIESLPPDSEELQELLRL